MLRNFGSIMIATTLFASCGNSSKSATIQPQQDVLVSPEDSLPGLEGGNDKAPGQVEPKSEGPDFAADLRNYETIASHYIELPYGLDRQLVVPRTQPEDVLVEESYVVARQLIEGRYQIRPLKNLLAVEGIQAGSNGSTSIQLGEFLRVGQHVLLVRTKTGLYGMDIEVASRAPERWSEEEPASCGNGYIDCNARLKTSIAQFSNSNGDLLLKSGTGSGFGAPYSFVITFKKSANSAERYLGGKFSYSLKKNLNAPAYLNSFPTDLLGTCSLRSGHLACKSTDGEKLFVSFSYYQGNPTFELLFNDRTFKMIPQSL